MATETQRSRFRAFFNDAAEAIWNDTEVDDIFEEAAELATSDGTVMVEAKIIGIDRLMVDASKRTSYKQNDSSQNDSDIFKALATMRGILEKDRARLESSAAGSAVRVAQMRKMPARTKDYPSNG